MRRLRIVYDGDCPFCRNYVGLIRLREAFDLQLVDARQDPALAETYGRDLDAGMIADLDGEVHHGADAVWLISVLSRRPGLFASRWVARLLYPVLRAGRNLALKALGRRPIRDRGG